MAGILSLLPDTGSFVVAMLQGFGAGDTYIVNYSDTDEVTDVRAPKQPLLPPVKRASASPAASGTGSEMTTAFIDHLSRARNYHSLTPGHAAQAAREFFSAYDAAPQAIRARVGPTVAKARQHYDHGRFVLAASQLKSAFADVHVPSDDK